jgi:hypothetical protein
MSDITTTITTMTPSLCITISLPRKTCEGIREGVAGWAVGEAGVVAGVAVGVAVAVVVAVAAGAFLEACTLVTIE